MILFPVWIKAQNISVKSFKMLETDLEARVISPKKDQNGDKCAIIKVVTSEKGFVFDGDMNGIVTTVYKTGEYWIYVPWGAKKITIKHAQLGVLRNYIYPIPIKEATVYEMVLTTGEVVTTVINEEIPMQWLTITSTPDGADVYIDNKLVGNTPYSKKMQIGKYNYRLEQSMYYNSVGAVTLTKEKKETLTIILKPNFGYAKIITTPENGAKIEIDGKLVNGVTPFTTDKLISGKHTVKVKKAMFSTKVVNFEITDGHTTNLSIPLQPNFATITVKTIPSAAIYIDDVYKGTGIYTGRVMPGLHSIQAKKDKYIPDKKQFTFKADETKTISLYPLAKTGTIDIVSTPFNAKIKIDGKEYGTTPSTVKNLLIGEHIIELDKEGYGSIKKSVTILKDTIITLKETLQKGKYVIIKTNPTNANLKIDGKSIGKTPYSGYLSYGQHSIEINKEKYSLNKVIDVQQLDVSEFYFNIKKIKQDKLREARRLKQKGSKFILYSYDKMSCFGIGGGRLNIDKLGWYVNFKTNHFSKIDTKGYDYNANYTGKINLSNIYISGGITAKISYPIWFFAGLDFGYNSEVYETTYFFADGTKTWTKGPNTDLYGVELNPTCGLYLKYSFLIIKYSISYRFMNEKDLVHQFGVGYSFD